MLDIKLIRDNPDMVRKGLKDRGGRSLPDLEQLIAKDKEWRDLVVQLDELRAKRNKAADEVGKIKREKGDASALLKGVWAIKEPINKINEILKISQEAESHA